ncbi:hypothetical protein A2U14_05840 [Fusobacterium necrophorum subsp. funduliforme]|uniref:Uncharacterized protein n=1 Tax=Fusobacterium necrophorum subsp. funduliforme TaxID=143387 RepID=A0A162IGN2_9FUSO|nr:helix-turn-helix transcriptional regulator [Fusobacterium necrophorum]AYV93562.1 XRE family transcriptional regulator [Fusobacterium necrophorum subsp. funduliforme]AYV95729.1 XRE family transcriptional regulator [Fusobacterium necrophorum subsp. funduliforme]KYL00480.1 hypothetical protein A2J07_08260 [Fusobacterium necrophorum subsp. funduliforme]KYL00614.1 hypothetical protein A2J06_05405 [Fusobacterium necrophorum subsp. funduliforme]KYM39261.1 hypothetical protein A2U03_07930 [Fusobact
MEKNLLKSKVFERGKKMEELYRGIHISKSAMYRKMNGESCFTLKEIKGIVEFLGLSKEEMNAIFFN